ncbi:MAG: Uma2 family endonuclease [Dehalococcoidia bacterium]
MTTTTTTSTQKLTLDQFLALPETEPASEYAGGEVIQKPMPTKAHAILQLYLAMLLHQFLAQTGLGEVFPEWRCIFGPAGQERPYVPDLVVVSPERLSKGDALDHPYLWNAPDLAIEILSPGQAVSPFLDKILFYLQHGVRAVWVIDPAAKVVLVLRPGFDTITLTLDDQLEGGDVLPGFGIALRDLFTRLQS